MGHRSVRNRLLREYDPAVGIRHQFGFLVQLFLLRREHLGHWKLPFNCLCLQDSLLVLKSEQLAAVLHQRLQEVLVALVLQESVQPLWHGRLPLWPSRFIIRGGHAPLVLQGLVVLFLLLPQSDLIVNRKLEHKSVLRLLLQILGVIFTLPNVGVVCLGEQTHLCAL